MLPVQRVTATPSAVKNMQYAYLEHLHLYPKPGETPQQQSTMSFLERLENANAHTPSMKERDFLAKRQQFSTNEELLQQMNYTNGVHYSQLHHIQEKK